MAEHDGIITLDFTDASRASQRFKLIVDDLTYASKFDDHGRLHMMAPLLRESGEISWQGTSEQTCKRTITFSHFDSAFFTAIIWHGNYDLALHVVEPPDGRLGGTKGYIFPGRLNLNLEPGTGLGSLHLFGEAVGGTVQVQLYSLSESHNPRSGEIRFFVEFASRGNPARAPYCGTEEHAIADYEIQQVRYGSVVRDVHQRFEAVNCGKQWNGPQWERDYFNWYSGKL